MSRMVRIRRRFAAVALLREERRPEIVKAGEDWVGFAGRWRRLAAGPSAGLLTGARIGQASGRGGAASLRGDGSCRTTSPSPSSTGESALGDGVGGTGATALPGRGAAAGGTAAPGGRGGGRGPGGLRRPVAPSRCPALSGQASAGVRRRSGRGPVSPGGGRGIASAGRGSCRTPIPSRRASRPAGDCPGLGATGTGATALPGGGAAAGGAAAPGGGRARRGLGGTSPAGGAAASAVISGDR